jgi:anti-sigma regulatory factor (Ser/Thr protein kinase)
LQSSLPRSIAALDELFGVLDAFFERERIGETDRHAARLAAEEVFVNLVRYNRGAERILVALTRDGDRLRVTLIDRGAPPFDLTKAPAPRIDAPLEERTPGGLGIHLTRTLMDDVSYAHEAGTSTITLTRRLR